MLLHVEDMSVPNGRDEGRGARISAGDLQMVNTSCRLRMTKADTPDDPSNDLLR